MPNGFGRGKFSWQIHGWVNKWENEPWMRMWTWYKISIAPWMLTSQFKLCPSGLMIKGGVYKHVDAMGTIMSWIELDKLNGGPCSWS